MGEKWKHRFGKKGFEVKGEKGVRTDVIDWKDPLTKENEHRHEGIARKGNKKDVFSVIRKNKK